MAAAINRQQNVLSQFPVCFCIYWLLMIKNCLIESGPTCIIPSNATIFFFSSFFSAAGNNNTHTAPHVDNIFIITTNTSSAFELLSHHTSKFNCKKSEEGQSEGKKTTRTATKDKVKIQNYGSVV
jgi:hypothetical protein